MPLAPDFPVVARFYVADDAPNDPFKGCNCGAQPANRTLRHIAANRSQFSVWPPEVKNDKPA